MRSVVTNLLVLIILVCASACALADARAGPGRTLLIVGDSLSAGFGLAPGRGWATLLQSRLETAGYGDRVVNASISGDTTGGGVSRLPRLLTQHAPRVVLIELGGNDGLRGTPVPVIHRNLTTMIRAARKAGAKVVLAGMQMPPNYGPAYTRDFAQVYRDVAREEKVALIGFFLDGIVFAPGLMQADGIHPNEQGQPLLLANAWPLLAKALGKPALSAQRPAAASPAPPATRPAAAPGH